MLANALRSREGLKTPLIMFTMLTIALALFLFVTRVSGDADKDVYTIMLDNGILPPLLGKKVSVLVQNITQTHRENLLKIGLQRRLMLNPTWEERLRIINQTRWEIKQCLEERLEEGARLREMLRQGDATRGEFIVEMNWLMLEIRTGLNLLRETNDEAMKALQEAVSGANRNFAKQIIEENRKFQQEMKQLCEEMINEMEEVGNRIREGLDKK